MPNLARTLALGLALGLVGSAHAGWKTYFLTEGGIDLPRNADAFREAMIEKYGGSAPDTAETDMGFAPSMPESIVSSRGRYRSLRSFQFAGVPVHVYQNILDMGGNSVTAIAIRDEDIEWLWQQFTDQDGDGIADDLLSDGARMIIDAFKRYLATTDEKAAVQRYANEHFAKLISESVFHDLETTHPWVPRAVFAMDQLDTSWSTTITKKGRGHRLASRGMDLLDKVIDNDPALAEPPEGFDPSGHTYGVGGGE